MNILGLKTGEQSIGVFSVDKDIHGFPKENLVQDVGRLQKKLNKAIDKFEMFKQANPDKATDKTIVGISDFGAGIITYYSDKSFQVIWWASQKRLCGHWE